MGKSIMDNVLSNGGRVTRPGDLAVVYMQSGPFAHPVQDFQQGQQWARPKPGHAISGPGLERAHCCAC